MKNQLLFLSGSENVLYMFSLFMSPCIAEEFGNIRNKFVQLYGVKLFFNILCNPIRNDENATTISKHIWSLKRENIQYEIAWKTHY